jgi:hypothetical protein
MSSLPFVEDVEERIVDQFQSSANRNFMTQ